MVELYVLTLAALVVVGFFAGRLRASALLSGSDRGQLLHSLPAYHGLFTAALVLVSMLLVLAIGAPLLKHLANSAALSYFPPDTLWRLARRGLYLWWLVAPRR